MIGEYKINDKVILTDTLHGRCGEECKIVEIGSVQGLPIKLYTIEFEDGSNLPHCTADDLKLKKLSQTLDKR